MREKIMTLANNMNKIDTKFSNTHKHEIDHINSILRER